MNGPLEIYGILALLLILCLIQCLVNEAGDEFLVISMDTMEQNVNIRVISSFFFFSSNVARGSLDENFSGARGNKWPEKSLSYCKNRAE